MRKWKPETKKQRLVAEVEVISKNLAESHKAAMAQLTRARGKKAAPQQQIQAHPGFKKVQVKMER
jgi:hypothetical protein